jgi:ABC-type sugar transport system permease subunit
MTAPVAVSSRRRSRAYRAGVGYERPYFAFLLNTPALLAILLLAAYPILYSAWVSLHKYSLKRPRVFDFIGLSNYRQILESDEFWAALWITLAFTVLVVVLVVMLGLAIALLLNQEFSGRGFVRALILLPWAIPPVVNGLMWQWIYDSKVGALNGLLLTLGVIGEYRGWLSSPLSALLALVFADVWNAVPLAVILLLAALQRIPAELYDAARVDGGTQFQLFRHVTFPWLAQPLMIVLILQTLSAIRAFDIIYVLTAGGPGTATTTLTWKTFLTTFDALDFGLGNAYAITVGVITLCLAFIYFVLLYRRGEFEA